MRQAAVWTGLLLAGVYLLTTGGQTFISDGEVMLLTATRLIDAQTLTLPEEAMAFPQVVRGYGGAPVSRYGIGQPLLAALFYWVGRYVVGWHVLPGCNDFEVGKFIALLLPATATALTGGIVCAWATHLYRSVKVGVAVALLYGLGTLAWPYSRFFFSEPLFTACVVLAAYTLYRNRPLAAGVALGYAVATRIAGVVLVPAFALYAAAHCCTPTTCCQRTGTTHRTGAAAYGSAGKPVARAIAQTSFSLRQHLWLWAECRQTALLWFAVGMLPGAGLILLNNWVRFRTLVERGYEGEGFTGNILVGLYGLLFSPGKSVFLYVPLLLACPFALYAFGRRFRTEAVFIALVSIITLVESGLWWAWWGGWCWGPRFLVVLMPFLVLPMGVLLERRGWRMLIVTVLLPLSIGVNLLGILVDFNTYLDRVTQGQKEREALYLFEPAYSPVLAHLRMIDPWHMPLVSFDLGQPEIGFPQVVAPFISAAVVLLAVVALVQVWRTLRVN